MTYDRLRDFFLIHDPGLFRLRAALRGTLACVLSAATLYILASDLHRSFLLALVGALVVMNGALSTDDRTVREQRVTQALLPLFSAVPTVIGAFALPFRWIAVLLLLVFTFFAIDARKYGQRWNTLGGIAYVSYFSALFFKVPIDQIGWVLAGIFICGLYNWVIKFWLVPDRAQSAIAWSLSAYRASLRRFVRACRRELQTAVTLPLNREHLRARMVRINELALLSEDAVLNASDAMPGSGALVRALQGRIFDLELGARKIFESLERRSREATAGDLALLEKQFSALRANEAALVAEEEASVAPASLSPIAASATGLTKVRFSSLRRRLPAQTRQAIQATIATLVATLVGTQISADRWYWAPLTAYVIFTGTTRGDSIRRAWSRLAGTALGVGCGLTIAYLLHGDQSWSVAVLFISMFCAIFAIRASYAWYVFFLTTLIALFYSLLQTLTPSLLYLRIEQTLVGGLCGAVSAFLVLPVSSRESLRSELAKFFNMLAGDLEAVTTQHLPRRDRRIRVRALERELLTLRAIAGPLRGPLGRPVREETRIAVHGASALVYYARMMIVFFPDDGSALSATARSLAQRSRALAQRVESAPFVDIADASAGVATWTEESPPDHEAATYSVNRLSQAISAFESRFPGGYS